MPTPIAPVSPEWRRILMVIWSVWFAATVIGSLLSQSTIHKLQPFEVKDTIEHFSAYAGLAFLLPIWVIRRRAAYLGCAGLPLLGLLMEFLQRLTPDRTFDLYDALANCVGILCGALLGFWLRAFLLRPSH